MMHAIGVEETNTPDSGNCQFHTLAEACLQQPFEGATNTDELVAVTGLIKKGVQAAAMDNFELEFADSTRRALLANVDRQHHSMSERETATAVKEFFADLADGPADPSHDVELRQ